MARLHGFRAESDRLNGYWLAVNAQLSGVRLPPELLPELSLHLRGGTFVFGADEGMIVLDGTSSPAALDVLVTRGENRGRFIPGIFEQDGGVLRICCDLSGNERPREFQAPLQSRRFLVTYQRGVPPRPLRHSGVV